MFQSDGGVFKVNEITSINPGFLFVDDVDGNGSTATPSELCQSLWHFTAHSTETVGTIEVKYRFPRTANRATAENAGTEDIVTTAENNRGGFFPGGA